MLWAYAKASVALDGFCCRAYEALTQPEEVFSSGNSKGQCNDGDGPEAKVLRKGSRRDRCPRRCGRERSI